MFVPKKELPVIRRISVAVLAVTLVAASLPAPVFAEQTPRAQTDDGRLSRTEGPEVASALAKFRTGAGLSGVSSVRFYRDLAAAPGAMDVRNRTRGIVLGAPIPLQQTTNSGFFATPRGKATLAVAVIAAAVFVGYLASRGPDPTPASTR